MAKPAALLNIDIVPGKLFAVMEDPKRLTPTPDTLRRLYLHSGNCCAFPGCDQRVMNRSGEFVGQICHIEGALGGSERFNENMSNEDRRAYENLMLMCYEHHVVTNNTHQYTVEVLQKMKADHEAIFADPILRLTESFTDWTEGKSSVQAKSLARFCEVLGWEGTPEDYHSEVTDFKNLAKRLERVPRRPREIFAALVNRGKQKYVHGGGEQICCLFADLREALEVTNEQLREQLDILDSHGLASVEFDYEGPPMVCSLYFDWEIWEDLPRFCKETSIPLTRILVDGDFSCLDG